MKKSSTALLISALTFLPTLAHAHPGVPGHTHGFTEGFAHPLLGLDHVLAMVALVGGGFLLAGVLPRCAAAGWVRVAGAAIALAGAMLAVS